MIDLGTTLDDRYLVTGELGQGGMSYVYQARDQHLERDVALKFLRPHLTETDRERFLREIKTLARLSHPGIVTIHDLGRGAGDSVYFVMELVGGGPFTLLGPFEPDPEPLRNLLEAAITLAETLHYVHRLGVVHRDVTPRNILLTAQLQPKVMDFGLVQLAETTRQLTRTGLTLGTPHYMAPEQAQSGLVGAHTDLYAFGAVLYKAVTGVTPFDADNDQAVLYQHVYGDIVPAVEHNPQVPAALSDLIDTMLSKDPHARPASGGSVAAALRTVLAQTLQGATQQRLGGPAQQGTYPYGPANPKRLQCRWQLALGEGPQWPGALTAAEGFVFLGLRNETVRALRPADGTTEAEFQTDDEVNTAPVYHHGHLAVVSRDGNLSLLSWPGGHTLWTAEVGAVGVTPFGRDLVVSSRDGTLKALTLEKSALWRYDAASPLLTPPVLYRGQAYAVTQEGWVHGVDAKTGEGKFKVKLGSVAAAPAAKDGLLLLPERSGELHAFDLDTLEVRWSYDLEGQLWASPVCWQSYVYAVSWANTVRCLSLLTGDDVWEQDVAAPVTATPVVAAGRLYVVTEGGQLLVFDALTGQLLFEDSVTLGPVQASPLVLPDTVIVAALDGTVKAYRSVY
ncbi:DNA damage-responsive serine/threonine-protein kinase RqkA [soil metagenome]